MRKVYVLISVTCLGKQIIEGIFTSRKKAEKWQNEYFKGFVTTIKTEVLI